MWKIEIHSFISRIIAVYYKLGIWKNDSEKNIGTKLVIFLAMVLIKVLVIIGACVADNKHDSMLLSNMAIQVVVIIIKCTYMLWRKGELLSFLQYFCVHSFVDFEEYTQAKRKLDSFVKFAFFYICVTLEAGVIESITSLPIVSSERKLPFKIWLPSEWKKNEIAFWTTFALFVVVYTICLLGALLSIFIWYLMLNCIIRYESLGQQLRTMGNVNLPATSLATSNLKSMKCESFYRELMLLIQTHRNIQKTMSAFKSCFHFLFLAQISTSGICLCSAVYLLAFSHDNLFQSAVYVAIIIYNLFEISMVSYFGNGIKLSSERLSYCIFQSNWIDQSQLCKRSIIIFVEFLKRPQELVIGKLYPLNLETFTSILSFTYSSFNILKTMR